MAARYSRSSSFPFRSEKEKYLKGVYDDDDDRSSRLQNCRRVESSQVTFPALGKNN